jgi:membrane-associated phospholipid phosphatase
MSWPEAVDTAVFRFFNQTLSNPVLDRVMPFFSGNPIFIPAVALMALLFLWKGGTRARVFVVLLLMIFALGDNFVTNTIKKTAARARPYDVLADVHLLAGKGGSGSMPSSHASTWFAATLIAYVFYRKSWKFMLPLACMVALSRMYVGVHYPSDVIVGAIVGTGYAAGGLWGANWLWQSIGRRWFGPWWERLPNLLHPVLLPAKAAPAAEVEGQLYFRMGLVLILVMMAGKLLYIASGVIQLSEDEAYQWTWSKHLALSYYSKPPLIAYAQALGTSIWGDNAFGVRFLAPVLGAGVSWMLLVFFRQNVNARAGFWLVVLINCTPFLSLGATLLTIDPLLVFFWTAAMLAGWKAVQPDGRTSDWIWVGVWTGLAFLAKYSAVYLFACFLLFFVLVPESRKQLRALGPYLALIVSTLFSLPVLIWNSQHDWITLEHVSTHVNLNSEWKPALRFFWEFTFVQAALLNLFFFAGIIAAAIYLWKQKPRNALSVYFFCMGPVVFLGHWLYSLHSRIHPNWIAPAIIPMLCMAVVYWERGWTERPAFARALLKGGIVLGISMVVLMHDTNLIGRIAGRPLPSLKDPMRRVRAWSDTAMAAGEARQELLRDGKPVFIIGEHYGLVGEVSFYLPEARARVKTDPLVYYQTSTHPQNQYYFWPGYHARLKGQNAIFIREVDGPDLPSDWFIRWLKGDTDLLNVTTQKIPPPAPDGLVKEFESVTPMGIKEIKYKGRVFRYLQVFACRNLL